MKNIIIMGPPGSGKDTQIEELKKYFKFEMIAGGDVARSLAKKDQKISQMVNHGELIKDDLILAEVDEIIGNINAETGIVFDGFPRDLYQAQKLSQILLNHHRTLDAAVYINVPEEEVVRRLSSRIICSLCGINIPIGANKCAKCGGRPVRRGDDEPAVVINRMQVFLDNSMPLVSYYKNQGILIEVNGEQSIKKVNQDISERLDLCQIAKN